MEYLVIPSDITIYNHSIVYVNVFVWYCVYHPQHPLWRIYAWVMGTIWSLKWRKSYWDRRGRTDRRDMEAGNRSAPVVVVGRVGRVRTGVYWDVWRAKKYLWASTLTGYVSEYGSFYGGRLGRRKGGGTADSSNKFRDVQHPERPEQGPGIFPTWNIPGQYWPGHIPGN